MMLNKQNQNAGANSQQLQATNMVVHVGIDEKRAREIYQEMNLQLRSDYSKEASTIASARVAEFENKLLPKMEAVDGALEAFADPSFQLLLVEAQKTAASTERPADYDLLAELLIHRFKKGENRIIRAGITRAVDIVDEISDDALLGLTVFHSVSHIFPSSGDILQGLDALNDLYGKILYSSLPTGNDWLDHLDILDAIRVSPVGNLKKIDQYYSEMLAGYIDVGIEKDSENYSLAHEILKNNRLSPDILVEHALNKRFVRLGFQDKNSVDSLIVHREAVVDGQKVILPVSLADNQKNGIKEVYDLYMQDEIIKKENIRMFMQLWDEKQNLKILKEWWDAIDSNIQLTSVGKVLAHSNAQRCDNTLPPLD